MNDLKMDFDRFWKRKWSQVCTNIVLEIDVNFELAIFTKTLQKQKSNGGKLIQKREMASKINEKALPREGCHIANLQSQNTL